MNPLKIFHTFLLNQNLLLDVFYIPMDCLLRQPWGGVRLAHLHLAYKPCFIRTVPPQTYGNEVPQLHPSGNLGGP